jgi:Reverse transcriptase (RNA-dependent DNA polymerase)
VGGDRIHYPGKVSTPTADLTTAKLLFNSVVSNPGARFASFDIKNFYLNNPMDRYKYMRIPVRDIPDFIMSQYKLEPLVHNGVVLVEIRKGMYGLPQAGIIANTRLVAHLNAHGYHQAPNTPGLFCHESRPISFCLVVDDFGIQYTGRQHAQHLPTAWNFCTQ